jgi:YidC/Oxa1 family membrane protein insertase
MLLVLGDAVLDALPADGAVDAAAAVGAAGQVGDVATQAADKNGGFFGVFSSVFETFLKSLDGGLHGAGIPYSYGFSIILLTLLVKLATFPLTKKQVCVWGWGWGWGGGGGTRVAVCACVMVVYLQP